MTKYKLLMMFTITLVLEGLHPVDSLPSTSNTPELLPGTSDEQDVDSLPSTSNTPEVLLGTSDEQDDDRCVVTKLSKERWKWAGNKGYAICCYKSEILEVPDAYPHPNTSFTPPLVLLDLSSNNISHLHNNSFYNKTNLIASNLMWLNLTNNHIKYIDSDAFYGLSGLLYLNLSTNLLTWPGGYGTGLFRPMLSLENLNIRRNVFDNFTNLGHELKCLKSLIGLFIEPKENCSFGPGFEELTNLANVSLSGHHKNACELPTITNKTLAHIPQVKRLWISSCNISNITSDAFSHMVNLAHLDISYNEQLGLDGMNLALTGLRNSTTLKTLNVNHINPFFEAGITLRKQHLENLGTLQALETLHMDLNKIEVLEFGVLLEQGRYFPRSLTHLTMTGNRLTYGKYVAFSFLLNITFIDISRQHLMYDPFFKQSFPNADFSHDTQLDISTTRIAHDSIIGYGSSNATEILGCMVVLPYNLQEFIWRKSFLYTTLEEIKICAPSLTRVDVSFNMIHTWIGPVRGLNKLKYLDLSDNTCTYIKRGFFEEFGSLISLDISRNNLGDTFSSQTDEINNDTRSVLYGLASLQSLDMSYTRITSLDKDVFARMPMLERLNLGGNMLSEFSVNLSSSRNLNYIDLSGNKLDKLPKEVTDYLDTLHPKPCKRDETNITVLMAMNAMSCSCDDLQFLQWINNTCVHVQFNKSDECRVNGTKYSIDRIADFHRLLDILVHQQCLVPEDHKWVAYASAGGSAILACLVTLLVSVSIYRNRWKLRFWYYNTRRFQHTGFEHLFANDAMVSYARSRAPFIKDKLMPGLTRHGLTIWVADKHSRPGASVAENIIHAICNSRKAVLLLDRDYMKDGWCDYEMNMALVESVETKRKSIIIVLMERLDMDTLPLTILRFLRNERSLEYPTDGENEATFWTNLADEIDA